MNDPSCDTEPTDVSPAAGDATTGSDPRDILRLRRCPDCDYDLRSLPEEYRCPECGFAYDRTMFAVYGWSPGERLSAVGRLLLGTPAERLIAVVLLFLLVAFAGFQVFMIWKVRSYSGMVFVVLLIAAVVDAVRIGLRRRAEGEPLGVVQLMLTDATVSLQPRGGRGVPVPLGRFARLRFRRDRFHRSAKKPLWHIQFVYPFWYVSFRRIEAMVECTPREAALVRGEIRRRMKAVGRHSVSP